MRGWLIALLCYIAQAAAHDLVDLKTFNPRLCVDLRLAGSKNIFGCPIYPANCIYVERHVATRLGRVQRELAKAGIGLLVLEGYRPPSVQCVIDQIGWACNYPNDAEHYRKGIGVDVMLYYLDGLPIKIPTSYQDTSRRAYRDYPYLSANAYHNSHLLAQLMTANGFVPQREKWWHFDLKGWEVAPNINVEYAELK